MLGGQHTEQLGESSQPTQGKDKETKDFLKSQFQNNFKQAMAQVDSIQEKTNKPSAVSKLKDKGRSAFGLGAREHPTTDHRVNDQIKEVKKPLNTFQQKEESVKAAILHSLPAEHGEPFVQTFQKAVQSFETSSNDAVDHYGKWNSDFYRRKRHGHEEELNNTRALLSHMVEDLSTWHQFRTDRQKGIAFCKDHGHKERRQELRDDLAKAKDIYAEVLKGYQKKEAEPPQRKTFREFVDRFGNALTLSHPIHPDNSAPLTAEEPSSGAGGGGDTRSGSKGAEPGERDSEAIEVLKEEAAKIEKQITVLEEKAFIQHAKLQGEQVIADFERMCTELERDRTTLDHLASVSERRIEDLTSQSEQNSKEMTKLDEQIKALEKPDLSGEETQQRTALLIKKVKLDEVRDTLEYDLANKPKDEPIRQREQSEQSVKWNTELCNQKDTLNQKLEQLKKMGKQEEQRQIAQDIYQLVSQGNKTIQDIRILRKKLDAGRIPKELLGERPWDQVSSELDDEMSKLLDRRNELHEQIAHLESVVKPRKDT